MHTSSIPLVSARGVHKTFVHAHGKEKNHVLKGIDLDIFPGEFVAIVGRSGSGKSTLLYTLSGLMPASKGSISLAGNMITELSSTALARVRRDCLGFIFQDLNLISSLNVADNVRFSARMAGAHPTRRDISDALAHVGLAGKGRMRPHELSGGQRQRVAIARALVRRPPLLFADEPTGSLDAATARTVMDLLQHTVTPQSALVMVTHDLDLAARAHRIIVLTDGAVTHTLRGATAAQLFDVVHEDEQVPVG